MPLLDETPGSNDQTSRKIATQEQLTDVETRHHRFAGAWVVGKQEVERLLREEPVVDGFNLVR